MRSPFVTPIAISALATLLVLTWNSAKLVIAPLELKGNGVAAAVRALAHHLGEVSQWL